MSEEKTETKVQIRIDAEKLKKLDAGFAAAGFHSRNEYICKAVDFYTSFLETKQAEDYLSETMMAAVDKRLKSMEGRICRTIFKLAVELAISSNVIAHYNEVDPKIFADLRKGCIGTVKKSLGNIQFDKIYSFQNRLGNVFEEGD
ncbi:MAG: hypothetical protein RSD08_03385 [Oscillospiraceae bacterium]